MDDPRFKRRCPACGRVVGMLKGRGALFFSAHKDADPTRPGWCVASGRSLVFALHSLDRRLQRSDEAPIR